MGEEINREKKNTSNDMKNTNVVCQIKCPYCLRLLDEEMDSDFRSRTVTLCLIIFMVSRHIDMYCG